MPKTYESMSREELLYAIAELEGEVASYRAMNLALDITRGKPSSDQERLSYGMLTALSGMHELTDGGGNAANYGLRDGLLSARTLFAQMLDTTPERIMVLASSSLPLMYAAVSHAWTAGIGGAPPWSELPRVRFLCPSPGYDRHFAITESFGIENVTVPLTDAGPDMEIVERLVCEDDTIKGMWCVPKYANPTGITYSDAVVRRLAALRPQARDFRLFWDNAYAVHDFASPPDTLLEIFGALDEADNDNLVYEFASLSKVTFPGSSMAAVAASVQDLQELRRAFAVQQVSPNTICQLMHTRFLPDVQALRAHMARHAELLRPRFALVERKLSEGLSGCDNVRWSHPKGGYFVSFDGPSGSAQAIVALAADLGVMLTKAGATYPYGNDPRDTNIRLAPSYLSLADLSVALDVFVTCVKLTVARLVYTKHS